MATALCQRATITAVVLRRFAGWNELSFLSFYSDGTAGYCGGAGVHRTTGGGTVLFSSPVDFVWVVLAVLGLWFLLPLGQDVSHVDLTGCALALGAGACWAIYILSGQRAGAEHGPATVAIGSLIAALIFVPIERFRLVKHSGTGRLFHWVWLSLFSRPLCLIRWK